MIRGIVGAVGAYFISRWGWKNRKGPDGEECVSVEQRYDPDSNAEYASVEFGTVFKSRMLGAEIKGYVYAGYRDTAPSSRDYIGIEFRVWSTGFPVTGIREFFFSDGPVLRIKMGKRRRSVECGEVAMMMPEAPLIFYYSLPYRICREVGEGGEIVMKIGPTRLVLTNQLSVALSVLLEEVYP